MRMAPKSPAIAIPRIRYEQWRDSSYAIAGVPTRPHSGERAFLVSRNDSGSNAPFEFALAKPKSISDLAVTKQWSSDF